MKTRFSTIDIRAAIAEIREQFVSLRAVNIYDVDNKTYIIKFNKPDSKMMLLMESGTRLHITEYEWPKNATPSGFTMKLRKHLRSRRLESVDQLGSDRIVDLQFGSGEAAYHVVLELYDRGNIVLTDSQLIILNILRPRTDDSQDVRFAVKEKYPVELAKQPESFIGLDGLRLLLVAAQPGDNLRKILNPVLPCGPAVVEHCLLTAGFAQNVGVGKGFNVETDLGTLCKAVEEAEAMTSRSASVCRGYIVQRAELRPAAVPAPDAENTSGSGSAALLTYDEFHPFLLRQHGNSKYIEFDTFNKAVDEFFSKLEAQKIDLKALQAEKAALRKLDNVKKDHEKRLTELQHGQEEDSAKAELIEMNLPLVDRAILIVNSAIANQFDWAHIWDLVREAQLQGDPVARAIKGLKLDTNHVTLLLQDPYSAAEADDLDDSSDEERKSADLGLGSSTAVRPMKIDVDLGLSAYANAKKYYDHRRLAVDKMQKTVLASSKALRSAERTTKELLKDAQSAATINKARRVHWFEKFLWLITSENYLAVGGRDAQQNEIIVKRHLRPGDVYVHADLHGAASIVVKNPSGAPIPPKTLNEVGCMAICNSAAWDAKVVTSAWWVYHDQVSKTAPTGEYLTTGSFMVRGKKNYLPPSHLIYGFGLLFKLDEESTARHRGERRVRTADEEAQQQQSAGTTAEGSGAIAAAPDSEAELSGVEAGDSSSSSGDDDSADEVAAVTESELIAPSNPAHADHASVSLRRQLDSKAPQSKGEEAAAVVPELTVEGRVKLEDTAGDSDGSSEGETAFPDTRIRVPSLAEGDSFASRLRAESVVNEESAAGRPPAAASAAASMAAAAAAAASTLDRAAAAADGVQRIVVGSEVLEFGCKVTRERKSNASQVENSSRDKKGRGQQPQRHGDADDVEGSSAGHLSSQVTPAKHSSAPVVAEKSQAAQLKRGQKSKLRKIKEKYADQDDEERQLRMSLLRSAPPPKAPPPPPASAAAARGKAGARGGGRPPSGAQAGRGAGRPLSAVDQRPLGLAGTASGSGQPGRGAVMLPAGGRAGRVAGPLAEANGAAVQNDGQQGAVADCEDDEEDEQQEGSGPGGAQAADVDVLDSLTGRPAVEDLLLFAIPFCAPYSVLQNFKFKVKLTPGTTKRGKASKAAIQSFLHDKAVTAREKDLLKALKDVDVSRNMPGKVKVSAPNLHRSKGK